jgi:hypothetical protein
MLIAAMLYYLVGLFGSGGDVLIIDVQKPLKQYVIDPARVAQLLAINETMQQQGEAFRQKFSQQRKDLSELNSRRLTTEAEFAAVFASVDQNRSALRVRIVAERSRMKGLMSADEWAKVYALGASGKP